MLHARQNLKRLPPPAGTELVVVGHSHRPEDRRLGDGGPRLVNPGSAGRRRFRLPVSCALLAVDGGRTEVVHRELVPPSPAPDPALARGRRRA